MRDRLEDTDFTDDIHLLAQRFGNVEEKLRWAKEEAMVAGVIISVNKTKELWVNAMIEERLNIYDKEVEQVDSFTYLGSIVT
jgi:hypothetical protein